MDKRRPAVAEALRSIHEGDIFLTAIGASDRISNDEQVNLEVLAAARAAKAVADICTVLVIAVRAALRGRLVSDLLTDTVTARWLLGEIASAVA